MRASSSESGWEESLVTMMRMGMKPCAEVVEARVGCGVLGVAGVGGNGDLLMRVVCGVLRGGEGRRDLAGLVGVGGEREREGEGGEKPQVERHTSGLSSGGCSTGKANR